MKIPANFEVKHNFFLIFKQIYKIFWLAFIQSYLELVYYDKKDAIYQSLKIDLRYSYYTAILLIVIINCKIKT